MWFTHVQHDNVETESVNYKVSEKAIKDKGLLGTQAQEMCENVDVYWMTQTCDAESNARKCSLTNYNGKAKVITPAEA